MLECDKKLLTKKLLAAFEKQFNMNFIDFEPDSGLLEKAAELAGKKYALENWNRYKKFEQENA
jgi:hypothetical protein